MQKFWRWLGLHIHDWAKWEETAEIRHRHPVDGQMHPVGTSQERRCRTCGFKQFHKQYRV